MNVKPPITRLEVPKWASNLLNQLYEVERKLSHHGDSGNVLRNVAKMKTILEEQKLFYEDPMGQPFKETRTDLEATICGQGTENLHVVEVIKPILRCGTKDSSTVFQKGIVVVESQPIGNTNI
jgi:hypothetical protein